MSLGHLRPALLAALAALPLAAGALALACDATDSTPRAPAPPTATSGTATPEAATPEAATPEAGTREPGTVTILLHPGWNAVGWVGPDAPVSELLDAFPRLQRLAYWDAKTGEYYYARPGRTNGLPALTTGAGLWLYLSGDSPLSWTRPAATDGVVLRLGTGRPLVGVVADGALNPPDDAGARAWRWDPVEQGYEPYRFGDAILSGGEAVWIEAAAPFNLWQPGTAKPPFVFLGDIPDSRRQVLLTEYAKVRRFFAEEFAVATRSRPHYIGADVEAVREIYIEVYDEAPRRGFCGRTNREIDISVLRCIGPPEGTPDWDYVDALLLQIPGKGVSWRGVPTLDPRGPGWLVAGARQYALEEYRGGPSTWQQLNLENGARRISLPLGHFEVTENRDGDTNFSEIALGFFAVEWLAERAGNPAVFDYFRLMRTSTDWRAAFATAFGIDVQDFYREFAEYRAAVLTALPHLTDDLAEPVLVFLGGVPAETATDIRTEFEEVRRFFADRFGVEATEFTLYIAPDDQTVHRTLPVLGNVSCSVEPFQGRAVLILEQCGSSLRLDEIYRGAVVQELAPLEMLDRPGIYNSSDVAPQWLSHGLTEFTRVAYGSAMGRLNLEAYWGPRVDMSRTTEASLRDLATDSGGRARALGFLAVSWLAEYAGEPAVFEYYRVLPSSLSRADAFEQAFGLTLDDFYDRFEAYRAELATP